MTNKSKLSTAKKLLQNVKVCPKIAAGLAKREVVPVEERLTVEEMEIAKFLSWVKAVKPIRVQRNDAYRVLNGQSKHLAVLMLPQCVFAVVFLNGVFYLIDGNTRKRSWLECSDLAVPSSVQVVILLPEDLEEAKRLYECYDSNASKKTKRDEAVSFLFDAGIDTAKLKSKLVAGGKFVTVAQAMGRKYHLVNNAKTRAQVITSFAPQFEMVDALGLDEGTVPMGAVWAALSAYKALPEISNIITQYMHELKLFDGSSANQIAACIRSVPDLARQACMDAQKGTSGAAACAVMYPVYLQGLKTYLRSLMKSKMYSSTTITAAVRKLDKFIASEFS